jgi:hypothetical protein
MTRITEKFDAPPVIGQVASGVSTGPGFETRWEGIYEGVRPSEHDGQPMHFFRDGKLGDTPQTLFALPVEDVILDEQSGVGSLVDLRRMLTTARDTEIEGGLTVTILALGRVDDDHDFGGLVVDLDEEAVTIEDPQRRRTYPVVYDLIDQAWITDANGEVREEWNR